MNTEETVKKDKIDQFRDDASNWLKDEDDVKVIEPGEKLNSPSITVAILNDGETLFSLNVIFNEDEEDVSTYVDLCLQDEYTPDDEDYIPESLHFEFDNFDEDELKDYFIESFWSSVNSIKKQYFN